MLTAAVLASSPSTAWARNFCTSEPFFTVSTPGKGYGVTFLGSPKADPCVPTGKKHIYTCQGGEGRYTLKIEPAGTGIRVTQDGQSDVLLPCR